MTAPCSQLHELDPRLIVEAVRIHAERSGPTQRRLVRLHLPLGNLDPWTLLTRACEGDLFVAWQDGRTGDRFAGLGAAAEVRSNDISTARQRIDSADVRVHTIDERGQPVDDSSLPTWIGGFAFAPSDGGLAEGPWEGWPAGWLWIPRIMLWRGRSDTALLVTAELGPELSPDGVVQRLLADCSVVDGLPQRFQARERASNGLSESDLQPRSDWLGRAELARTAIADGAADKIVVARTVALHAPNARFDVLASLRQLQDRHGAPEHGKCTLYAIGGRDGSALLGATPETLVHLDGKNLITAAIAGTAPRKANPEDDRGEAAQLVASRKEQREHRLVVHAMQEALGPLCRRLTIDASPIVRKLSLMQHLETPIRGELRKALHVLDLVQALHPTPAVAGWPTQEAIGWLRKHEPVDRGWYAGPLGWTSANGGGHFVVALRCALVRGNTAWAYAGAGITDRSVPAAEWDETTLKLRTVGESLRTG